MNALIKIIWKNPLSIKLRIWKRRFFPSSKDPSAGLSKLNVLKAFPAYIPCSGGSYAARSPLTINAINGVFPSICRFLQSVGVDSVTPGRIEDFARGEVDALAVDSLGRLFDQHGSDKANECRSYHPFYAAALKSPETVKCIVEVGLGTNNTDVVSNMGSGGKPGASLRAFRAFCPNARIIGADIDRRILFNEERIETHYIDQTCKDAIETFGRVVPDDVDLFIDDGLHSPHANINTMTLGLSKIRIGGWMVVEDIGSAALPIWAVVAALLPSRFSARLLNRGSAYLFVVKRLE